MRQQPIDRPIKSIRSDGPQPIKRPIAADHRPIKESLGLIGRLKASRAHAEVVLFIYKQQPVTSSSFYYMRVFADFLSMPVPFISAPLGLKYSAFIRKVNA